MASLFEINRDIEELTNQLIDEETGEVNEEILARLEELAVDQDEKLENYGLVMKQLVAEADALKKEADSLKKRMTAKLNRYARMEELVNRSLNGKAKEYTRVSFGYRKSQSVEVVNDELVPDDLCEFVTQKKPRKTDIKKLLKDDKEVPGCVLIEKMNLQVK